MKLPAIKGFGAVYKREDPDGRVRYIASIKDQSNKRRQPTFDTARQAADHFYMAHRQWPGGDRHGWTTPSPRWSPNT